MMPDAEHFECAFVVDHAPDEAGDFIAADIERREKRAAWFVFEFHIDVIPGKRGIAERRPGIRHNMCAALLRAFLRQIPALRSAAQKARLHFGGDNNN
jgi:hypothetical protein